MEKDHRIKRGSLDRAVNSRPTIAYLAPSLGGISQPMWSGVVDAARKRDVNLICFPGWSLRDPRGFQAQANVLYDLVDAENVDGVVSWASSMGNYVDADEIRIFHERYRPLPVVSVGRVLEGIPTLLMDSYRGMREAVSHLIEVHGYRRLAFIRGPEGHVYAQGRYQAYVETLEAYGLPLDPNLVTPPIHWGYSIGVEAMRLLLDERGLRPRVNFEAVVAANEGLLLGALDVLRARGIQVPEEAAVVGFDDTIRGQTSTPPFTSVAAPFYETGYQAVETLLALMGGGQVPPETIVPSKLVVRRSCSCQLPAVVQASAGLPPAMEPAKRPSKAALGEVVRTRRARILSDVVQAIGGYAESAVFEWAEQLLDGFVAEVENESPDSFLFTLEGILSQAVAMGGDPVTNRVGAWQGAVSTLRRGVLPYLDGEARSRAESLWQQARVVIGQAAQRAHARQTLQVERQTQVLREIEAALVTTFDLGELMDILAGWLPRLGIPGCYLSLYENPTPYQYPQPVSEWSRLILACDGRGRIELEPEGRRFPSRQLVPEGMLRRDRWYGFVVEPLYLRESQLGFVLFEMGPRGRDVYAALHEGISSTLYGALLLRERQQAEEALGDAYAGVEKQVEERTCELQQEILERRRAEEELERYREHLEDLAVERTRELQEAQAELVRQERLSALGQLTATIAHEIRNPLGTMRISVYTIGDAIERGEIERIERALQLAERNIVRCDAIISGLLDYTRDRVLRRSPTDVDGWLDGVLDEQAIPEGVVCVRELNANVEVSIDREHLRHAVVNVVNNAVDAMRGGKPVEGERRLTVSTHVVGDRLEIRVSDTGCGIPDEVKGKLFELLVSTKSFGVGLGLPIVRDIMERHGGGIEISSKPGVGTTITLWLPTSNGQ